jgi:hypothetical protein
MILTTDDVIIHSPGTNIYICGLVSLEAYDLSLLKPSSQEQRRVKANFTFRMLNAVKITLYENSNRSEDNYCRVYFETKLTALRLLFPCSSLLPLIA